MRKKIWLWLLTLATISSHIAAIKHPKKNAYWAKIKQYLTKKLTDALIPKPFDLGYGSLHNHQEIRPSHTPLYEQVYQWYQSWPKSPVFPLSGPEYIPTLHLKSIKK